MSLSEIRITVLGLVFLSGCQHLLFLGEPESIIKMKDTSVLNDINKVPKEIAKYSIYVDDLQSIRDEQVIGVHFEGYPKKRRFSYINEDGVVPESIVKEKLTFGFKDAGFNIQNEQGGKQSSDYFLKSKLHKFFVFTEDNRTVANVTLEVDLRVNWSTKSLYHRVVQKSHTVSHTDPMILNKVVDRTIVEIVNDASLVKAIKDYAPYLSSEPKGPIADFRRPDPPPPLRGRMFAVIIGVSDYKDLLSSNEEKKKEKLVDLKYAHKDAKDFLNFLEDSDRSGGSWILYPFIGHRAKTTDVKEGIDKVMTEAGPNDLVYFFFSGHGRHTPYDQSEIYLLTYDAEYKDYYSGISYDWLKRKIENSRVEHLIAFIDACRSGTIGFGKGGGGQPDVKLMGRLKNVKPNKVIFTSGGSGQQAFENNELENGFFTHFLIKGLKGAAPDRNKSGYVELSELRDYVKEQVRIYSSSHPPAILQIPRLWERKGLLADEMPLAIRK